MEDYYQQRGDKIRDFILGFILNFLIALGAMFGLGMIFATGLGVNTVMKILIIAGATILLTIVEVRIIKQYLKQRRYVAIGLIVGIVFPLLVIGTCSPLIFAFS